MHQTCVLMAESNPGCDHGACVLEQDTFTVHCFSLPRSVNGYKWVPVRVEVDIVFEKAAEAQH